MLSTTSDLSCLTISSSPPSVGVCNNSSNNSSGLAEVMTTNSNNTHTDTTLTTTHLYKEEVEDTSTNIIIMINNTTEETTTATTDHSSSISSPSEEQQQQPTQLPTTKPSIEDNDDDGEEYFKLNGYEWKHLFLMSCSNGDLLLFKQLIDVLDKRIMEESSQSTTTKREQQIEGMLFFNVNVSDERKATALHKSCAYGHIAITRELLLRNDVDKYCVDNSLATPFHYAAASGNVLVVNLLYSHAKQSLDSRDVFGNTPLLLAMQNGKLEAVRFLLSVLPTNSIRTKKSTNSRSLLHLAAANYDIEGMKLLLLERNEFIKERNKKRKKLVDLDEIDESDHDLDELMYRECLQDLCYSPRSPTSPTGVSDLDLGNNSSALKSAGGGSGNNDDYSIELSAHGKVLIQAKEENGLTPLMLAIKEYRSLISKSLAEKQLCLMYLLMAEMSSQHNSNNTAAQFIPLDSMKRTSMHLAAIHDCADFFRIVALTHDTESYLELLMLKDNNGFTPLHLACKQGSINVVDTILLMCTQSIPSTTIVQHEGSLKVLSPPSPLSSTTTTTTSSTTNTSSPISSPIIDGNSSSTTTTTSPIVIKKSKVRRISLKSESSSYSNNGILVSSPPSSSPSIMSMSYSTSTSTPTTTTISTTNNHVKTIIITPNTQTSLKVLNGLDSKNRPPIFYAALAMAKHCKKEAKEAISSPDSAINQSGNTSFSNSKSIQILGARGDKETFQKIIFNLISSGLVSLHSNSNSPTNSIPNSPSKHSSTPNPLSPSNQYSSSSASIPSSTFEMLSNETDYFEKFPQHFRVHSPTNNNQRFSKRNFEDFYSSNPLHSPSQIHSTRTARSMSNSGFSSLRKTFGFFQSSSLAEDTDIRPPTSPNKR